MLAIALAAAATGCSGDDDDAVATTTEAPATVTESTVPETTEAPPETTVAPSTAPPTTAERTTTVPPSTTISEEDLKAEIAADYQRSWQLRRELIANPTLDGLDAKLAEISAPGSASSDNLADFVTELESLGERAVAGTPDIFDLAVERIDLVGMPRTTKRLPRSVLSVTEFAWVPMAASLRTTARLRPGARSTWC